jgi:hypothetical protein
MSAEHALLAAMRTALLADAALATLVGARIYDDPPTDVVFPYVTLGRIETRAADASAAVALDHVVTLHVWSRHGGRAEALNVIAAIRDDLHHAALELEGHRLTLLLVTFTDVFRSGDGRTTHGVVRLRAVTEPE